MSNNDVDTQSILRFGAMGTIFMAYGSVKTMMYLYQTMKKMHYAKKISKGELEHFEELFKYANGDVKIINVPLSSTANGPDPEQLFRIKEELKTLNIGHHVMPNLGDKGQIQLAFAGQDVQKMELWFQNYVDKRLHQEGIRDLNELRRLTDGQFSILNVPVKNPEDLSRIREDLQQLNIGHYILPRLSADNGQIQIAVANQDVEQMKVWFDNYAKMRLKEGNVQKMEDLKNLTNGNYNIVNIPTETVEDMEQLKEALMKLQIGHYIPNDANPLGGNVPLAYDSQEEAKVQTLLQEYATAKLNQGEIKDLETLRTLTNGEYSVINLPVEKSGDIAQIQKEFNDLKIGHHVLSDLSKEDGQIMIAVADRDHKQLESWMQNYQEIRLKDGRAKDLEDLKNLTDGKFNVINVPLRPNEDVSKLTKDLDALGVQYHVIPDLSADYEQVQVAFSLQNEHEISLWYQNRIDMQLKAGGEHSLNELKILTNDHISVINLPVKNEGEIVKIKEDLDQLRVNYHQMPDLNYAHGQIQLAYASSNTSEMKAWLESYQKSLTSQEQIKELSYSDYIKSQMEDSLQYDQAYQESLISQNPDIVSQMQKMTTDEYLQTAAVTPDDYWKTAPLELREEIHEKAIEAAKEEMKETPQVFQMPPNQAEELKESLQYQAVMSHPGANEVIIAKEQLIPHTDHTAILQMPDGDFCMVNTSCVQPFKEGQSYKVVLEQEKLYSVCDIEGNMKQMKYGHHISDQLKAPGKDLLPASGKAPAKAVEKAAKAAKAASKMVIP